MSSAARCPFSDRASTFDPFDTPFQTDPAEALRWAREQEPIFWSDAIGYWVVARYDDVKAVFRDNRIFSPAIALEKMTPPSAEAQAILKRYRYAMNRTLVNEDEPAHMERRRALMASFELAELAHHEPMVRRLTREYMDRFIDRGRADLVDEMLWEIPLTVALHFLGVPEEDMATLRKYSIAHTVNTWGKPSPEEQAAVAEAVGRFWTYSGEVLEKMRRDPSGHGWMEYAIRRQKALPDVVTDSYLHSMMMAGIVAAHETTAHATANMLRLLLERRDVWDDICANPSLIPNAVEECLRFAGSIVAWRRVATADTAVGGVKIARGERLLIVMASANHDPRNFENPDEIDIYRDNTAEHLSFGYGSHQCLGKNLARMEMRIFLEAFTRRLPHMRLAPGQTFTYLPNASFRGPDHLLVQWDPAANPERGDSSVPDRSTVFPLGTPNRRQAVRQARVAAVEPLAEGVAGLVIEDPRGRAMPRWTAGSHVDLLCGPFERKYSICGDPGDRARLHLAVLKEEGGRGGSLYVHERLRPGDLVSIRGPRNHFHLDLTGERYLLIAGGIGITPIIAMADALKQAGKVYEIHYAGRAAARMAFLDRLRRDHGEVLHLYPGGEGRRLPLEALADAAPADCAIYACGPERLLSALQAAFADWPGGLHVEHFSSAQTKLDPAVEHAFDVELADSDLTVGVAADRTVLEALRAAGVDVPSDCEEGICGSCEVAVIDGEVDHRDRVLTPSERRENRRMMVCCSRARGTALKLAL